ncbi:hypothetical protein JCM6882_009692 [Rhodosporidiobolus microsporus]
MASNNNGYCCVCGTSTAQRCSACCEAGFDLFFCSREHQKLVYFTHKKVCGKNAKPFRFPPLSPEELHRTKELAFVELPGPSEYGGSVTISTGLSTLSSAPTLSILADLSQPTPRLIQSKHVAAALSLLRSALMEQAHDFDTTTQLLYSHERNLPELLPLTEPLEALSHFAMNLNALTLPVGLSTSPKVFPIEEDWFISLMHHGSIFCTLRHLFLKDRLVNPSLNSFEPFLFSSARHLCDCLQEMAEQNPQAGEAMETAFELIVGGTPLEITLQGVKRVA